jgi:KipI family sensor histidine kinase inhibitor
VNLRSYGGEALLVELADGLEVAALRASLEDDPPLGLLETMPGLRTVLVRFDVGRTGADQLARTILGRDLSSLPGLGADASAEAAADVVRVRVDYAGADLDEVAALTGLTREEIVAAHQAPTYRVVLIGMAPGFYYLAGGDPRLHVPRRRTPRTDVPKGAVGLAGDLTGIYPRLGPGGWQLIGTTMDELWHPTNLPAALLSPGTAVRFEAA